MRILPAVLLSLVLTLSLNGSVLGAIIEDPENVTYMKAEVTQSGHITLNSKSSSSTAEDLVLSLYVPQNDSRQLSTITRIIGPDTYLIDEGEYGNAQIVMTWKKPPIDLEIDYLVETLVEIEDISSEESRYFPVTSVVEPSQGIIETAYIVGGGDKAAENMLALSNWVHENIDYDLSCEMEAFPAKWVYDEGRGTCDEYSNLLLSMLRTLDYNAWYVAGYAYLSGKQEGGESFGAHAWVEARLNGKTYSLDPTWAEAPVDATHITFARLPDSNFTEHTEVKSRNIELDWNKEETRLELVDFIEKPRITIQLETIPESVHGGKNVMLIAGMEADGCVATNLRVASCIDDKGDNLIEIGRTKQAVSFCDDARFYWFGETPTIRPGMKYTCPVSVAGGGWVEKIPISITSEPESGIEITTSMQKILVPGETMEVDVSLKNAGYSNRNLRLFAMLGDIIKEGSLSLPGGGTGDLQFEFTSPHMSGEYDIHIFSSSGDLMSETIEVISERQLKITEISIPKSLEVGSASSVNVTLRNFGGETTASVKLNAMGSTDVKNVLIESNETIVVSFGFSGENEGINNLIISVLDSGDSYQDSWTGNIDVFRQPSIKDSISKQIEDFIMWLLDIINSIFSF